MVSKKITNLSGIRIGRLSVVERDMSKKTIYWKCVCDCGKKNSVQASRLIRRLTNSCGCINLEMRTSHGMTKSREYACWQNIKARCYFKKHKSYPQYGGSGVKVCDRWINSFENFIHDMGKKPSKTHSIERINNKGDYEPSNCRWATRSEQDRNKSTNKYLEYKGLKLIESDWAKRLGISRCTLRDRLKIYKDFPDIVFFKGRLNAKAKLKIKAMDAMTKSLDEVKI